MIGRRVRAEAVRIVGLLLLIQAALLMAGCSPGEKAPPSFQVGSTQGEIFEVMGAPDQSQQFIIPDEPFFGPQEELVEVLPAGTEVEEWQYASGDQVLYIWFIGDNDQPRNQWVVISHASYPSGAIY